MTTEDDVSRVLAVTHQLAGPQYVWVLSFSGVDHAGNGVYLFISEAVALTAFPDIAAGDYGYEDAKHIKDDADEEEREMIEREIDDGIKLLRKGGKAETSSYIYKLEQHVVAAK